MTTLSDSRDDPITELHTTATLAFTEVALFKRTAWRLGHGAIRASSMAATLAFTALQQNRESSARQFRR